MRQSNLFTKTRKEAPKDEISKNANLLIRAGFIHKEMAGVYSFLPLGLRVLNNVISVIRKEIDAVGGQELLLPSLQDKALWEKTNRWGDDVVDVWFKTALKNKTEVGLGFTHEEPLTALASEYVSSYRDLPFAAYQFQNKFRNETRAKSGLMRTREFIMKDLYSFSRTQEEHDIFYEKAKQAYLNIFETVGLGHLTYLTYASGGVFSKYSHEFQTVTEAGEDIIYISDEKKMAVNEEIMDDPSTIEMFDKNVLRKEKAVEVGNIFSLGTKFSEPLGLFYKDEAGNKMPVIMGCYGIGPARVIGTVVEALSDEKGIVWPQSIAPYAVHLIMIPSENPKVKEYAESIYNKLISEGTSVLYDDRDVRAGEKFADADLIGIPVQVVVSEKLLKEGKAETINRKTGQKEYISFNF